MRRLLSHPRSVTLYDQAVSSLTNFFAGLFAAKVLTPSEFGIFGLLSAGYILVLGATRAMFSDVSMVTLHETSRRHQRYFLGGSDALFCICFMIFMSFMIVAILVYGDALLIAISGAVALMLVQDNLRIISIAVQRPHEALVNDTLWLATLVILLMSLKFLVLNSAILVFIAWGLSATPGVIAGIVYNRWCPRFRRGASFCWHRSRLMGTFFIDWLLKQGISQVATYAVGVVGGLVAVGSIRAGLLVLGPLNVAFTGLQLAATPPAVRLAQTHSLSLRRKLQLLSAVLGALALGAGLVVYLLPLSFTRVLVGQQAEGLHAVILPLALGLAASGLMAGSHIGIRVLQASSDLLRTRLITSLLLVAACGIPLAVTSSVPVGLWGIGVGALSGVFLWDRSFKRALEAHDGKGAPTPTAT